MTAARERVADVLTGWPIGSGYYGTSVAVDEAQEMADALIAAFPVLGMDRDALIERAARAINTGGWTCEYGTDEPGRYDECAGCRSVGEVMARAILSAALGEEATDG